MVPKIFVFVAIIAIPYLSFAEQTNFIINFSRNDYKAGSQNWQVIQLDNQWIYFANKSGVLEYNGKSWNHYPLKNKTDARSLLYSRKDNRIYVGGINEIGYLEPASGAKKEYITIENPFVNPAFNLENVWKIYEIDDAIYFCGDRIVMKWLNKNFVPIHAPDKIDCSGLINNTLYIGTSSGIFILAGEAFYRLPNTETFTKQKIRSILPFGDKVMIATARNGLFLWDNNHLTPFYTDADGFIKKNELFSIAINDNFIAIGTVLKGLVLINREGKIINYFNESHGLQNNTILSMFFDKNDNLWLGLDNGIDYITLNYPITNLYAASGFYGAGYVARLYNEKLFLGTNRGLYVADLPLSISESPPQLRLIEGSQGQVWNLSEIDGRLFVCHDRGLFFLESNEFKSADFNIGVWDLRKMKSNPEKYWLSTYSGVFLFEFDKHGNHNTRSVSSDTQTILNTSIINYEEGNDNTLFIRHNRNELVRITLNSEQNKVTNEKIYSGADIPEDFFIYRLFDRIILCSPTGFYRYNSDETFIPDKELNEMFNFSEKNNTFRSVLHTASGFWALGENLLAVKYHDSFLTCYHNIPLITNFERIYHISDSTVIIPNENGFALWNTSAKVKNPDYLLQILDIKIIKGNNSNEINKIQKDSTGVLIIPYSNNSLFVEYEVIRYFNPSKLQFRTQLNNNPWSPFSFDDNIALLDLPFGKHIFRVETQLENGKTIEDSFSFIILPPWYLTTKAYIFYGILLVIFFFILHKLDSLRLERKKRQMKLVQEKELKIKEAVFKTENEKKQQEIIRLTNEKLEMEVRHKSQELANSALILGRKNELLMEIKKSLSFIFEKSGSNVSLSQIKRKILETNNIIDENIREDDIFHKFEENFDFVHNNFIKRLTETYPTLNASERKMCTLIKMQLSSKEIAPLLNISVRGAETLRLRLRKKLGLHNESLTKFLDAF